MAVIEMINGKRYKGKDGRMKRVSYKTHAAMRKLIDYIYNDQKTEQILKQGLRCSPDTAYKEFLLTKQIYNKTEDGWKRMVVHFTQSFKPGEVTPEEASEIAAELLRDKMFDGFQVAYATHIDRDHIHTHFVINACNQDTGHQWQMSTAGLQYLKDLSDELCRAHGLSIVQNNVLHRPHKSYGQHKAEENGTSWIKESKMAVDNVMKIAISKEDFIEKMQQLGYQTTWTKSRKYITWTFDTPNGARTIRNSRFFPPEKYTKEALESRFSANKQYQEQRAKRLEERNQEDMNEVDHMMAGAGILFRLMVQMGKQTHYPYQNQARLDALKTDNVEAKIERAREAGKGYGIDWEE